MPKRCQLKLQFIIEIFLRRGKSVILIQVADKRKEKKPMFLFNLENKKYSLDIF